MISLIVMLLIVGVALYLVGLVPMDSRILMAIRAVVLLVAVLYVLEAFGVLHAGDLPRLR